MTPAGRNLKAIQITAYEDNTGGGRRWENTDADGNAGVKPYAGGLDRPLDRRLESQNFGSKLSINTY
jgi:hypothetical protein